jgi:uncharacterized protein (TIGR00266 family)
MHTEILYRPSYSMTRVQLEPHEEIYVEAGSMVSMSAGITIETAMRGGLLKSITRSLFGGESFFMNTYQAPADGGEISLAPALPGDMNVVELEDESLMVQSGGFVAASKNLDVDTAWSGAKTFFASEGLIMLKVAGSGSLILASYGAIHELHLGAGEGVTIDTGHLVAFSQGIDFQVRRIGNITSTLFSGEGLVVDLTGPGRVLMQTRSADAFITWIVPKLPLETSGDGQRGFTFRID